MADMRPVGGSVLNIDGTAEPGDKVKYRLERVGWDTTSHYMPSEIEAVIEADGTVPQTELWASANGGRSILCIMPNGYTWRFRLESGDDPISLETLHLLYAPADPVFPPALFELFANVYNTLIGWIQAGVGAIGRTVRDKLRERVSLEDFGADPTGVLDSRAAFVAMLAYLASIGGGTGYGRNGATYQIVGDDWIEVPASNITIDLQGATIFSYDQPRFSANGDPGVDGGLPQLTNIHFKNMVIGGPSRAASNRMRGPRIQWCTDSDGENIRVWGEIGTCFNLETTTRCGWRNCISYGGDPTRFTIGFLAHMTDDSLIENCHVIGGSHAFADFQQKGGRNNTYKDCTVRNSGLPNRPDVVSYHGPGFWDRGDGPWKDSNQAYQAVVQTYRYADKGWGEPDIRRASTKTRFINCSVENSPLVKGFSVQEAIASEIDGCSAENVKIGVVLSRSSSAEQHSAESVLSVDADTGDTLLTLKTLDDAAQFRRGGIHPVVPGDYTAIELDTGYYFVTPLATVPAEDSLTLTITDPLPSPASIGREIYVPRASVLTSDVAIGAVSFTVSTVGELTENGDISIVTGLPILDNEDVHVSTIQTIVGKTITIVDPFVDAAYIGRDVAITVLGEEADFSVRKFRVVNASYQGVRVFGQKHNKLPGVVLSDITVDGTGDDGVAVLDATSPVLRDFTVRNVSVDGNQSRGVAFTRTDFATASSGTIEDLRDPPLMHTGLSLDERGTLFTIENVKVLGRWLSRPILAFFPGFTRNNYPGDGYRRTTDAVAVTDAWRCQIDDGQIVRIQATVIAQQQLVTPGTEKYAAYTLTGTFRGVGGAAVLIAGSLTATILVESDASWSCAFVLFEDEVQLQTRGSANDTVDWIARITMDPMTPISAT